MIYQEYTSIDQALLRECLYHNAMAMLEIGTKDLAFESRPLHLLAILGHQKNKSNFFKGLEKKYSAFCWFLSYDLNGYPITPKEEATTTALTFNHLFDYLSVFSEKISNTYLEEGKDIICRMTTCGDSNAKKKISRETLYNQYIDELSSIYATCKHNNIPISSNFWLHFLKKSHANNRTFNQIKYPERSYPTLHLYHQYVAHEGRCS